MSAVMESLYMLGPLFILLLPVIYLLITEFDTDILDFIKNINPFKKPEPPEIDKWEDLRDVLQKEYFDEIQELKEYENSFRLVKAFKQKPQVNKFIKNNLFSKVNDAPFSRRNNGLFYLKERIEEAIDQDSTGNNLESILNFVKLVAEHEAAYTVLTGDDGFYQNRYVDDRFKDTYNKFFMNTIDENMKRIVIDDIKANIMDKKYLGSGLMGKLYQENYVIERAKIKKEKNTLKNNYEALVELHNTNAISVEDFAKVFGDESIEIVEEADKIRTGS